MKEPEKRPLAALSTVRSIKTEHTEGPVRVRECAYRTGTGVKFAQEAVIVKV